MLVFIFSTSDIKVLCFFTTNYNKINLCLPFKSLNQIYVLQKFVKNGYLISQTVIFVFFRFEFIYLKFAQFCSCLNYTFSNSTFFQFVLNYIGYLIVMLQLFIYIYLIRSQRFVYSLLAFFFQGKLQATNIHLLCI